MGLLPLEYTDCLTDTPHFRENLRAHEKELDRTSQAIKGLIKEVKDYLTASKAVSRAQRSLATTFMNFRFDCIGCSQTDDEIVIAGSLKEFGRLLSVIEDERDRMLDRAQATLIDPIENFRKENIGAAKEGKKKFEKETTRFCQSLERHLNLSTKKGENHLQEADASLDLEQRHFFKASLEYAFLLTQIQERKKFEFVETILSFMCGLITFYHQGYEVANEFKTFMTDLQRRLQRIRENFEATHNEAEQLKQRTLEKAQDPGTLNKMYTRQGYLFLMEKKALGTTWTKHFVQYQKSQKKFSMMPYSQTAGKIMNGETVTIKECIRRQCDSIDKRFCFDVVPEDKGIVFTFQALSDEDRKLWLDAMDGKEPTYSGPGKNSKPEEFALDDSGFQFVQSCITFVEMRGLTDQGLYRLVGVNSKVSKLMQMALDKRKSSIISLDEEEWEIKTVTSALKNYFRNLPEPLLTFRLHNGFIAAAKQEKKALRVNNIHTLVHSLPSANLKMLEVLIKHLCKIAKLADKNLMTVSNLGVCFGPTLLRPEEETVAAIMDIKFGNVVVEILVENYDKIFNNAPDIEVTRKPIQPPPYVAPPPPPSKRDDHRPPPPLMQQTPSVRASHPDVYNFRNSHPIQNYAINPIQGNYPVAATEQKPRAGLMVYNPMWNENLSLPAINDPPTSWTGPPPRPPLSNADYSSFPERNIRAESIGSHRILPLIGESSSRDFYLPHSSELSSPEHVYSTVHKSPNNNNSVRKVRTLYVCRGENEMELSFEPNEIIYNVQPSHDPGWIYGTLRGKTGLIPENYVEFLP